MKVILKNKDGEKKETIVKKRVTQEGIEGVTEVKIEHKPEETVEKTDAE